jgi:hypothetical protein
MKYFIDVFLFSPLSHKRLSAPSSEAFGIRCRYDRKKGKEIKRKIVGIVTIMIMASHINLHTKSKPDFIPL